MNYMSPFKFLKACFPFPANSNFYDLSNTSAINKASLREATKQSRNLIDEIAMLPAVARNDNIKSFSAFALPYYTNDSLFLSTSIKS